jgi:hypothetical protein
VGPRNLIAAGVAGLLLAAVPALADITVIARYTLMNGDTLTRASYYTSKQIRTTLPNGIELIYDEAGRRTALIDHLNHRYWEGPRQMADSIASAIRAERSQALQGLVAPEVRNSIYSALSDSVHQDQTGEARTIAGYPCNEWVLTAGSYLRQERWVARSLSMPNFGPEIEKVVLASVVDPVGRGLMKLVLQARRVNGLTLAGMIRYHTPTQDGTMSWEALQVLSAKLPPETWAVPAGYERWEPKGSRAP